MHHSELGLKIEEVAIRVQRIFQNRQVLLKKDVKQCTTNLDAPYEAFGIGVDACPCHGHLDQNLSFLHFCFLDCKSIGTGRHGGKDGLGIAIPRQTG